MMRVAVTLLMLLTSVAQADSLLEGGNLKLRLTAQDQSGDSVQGEFLDDPTFDQAAAQGLTSQRMVLVGPSLPTTSWRGFSETRCNWTRACWILA